MASKKSLVTKKEVNESQEMENARVREIVKNQEAVVGFLRMLADQTAADPGVHSEIVKSATLVRIFLENQINGARAKFPQAFEEEMKDVETARIA